MSSVRESDDDDISIREDFRAFRQSLGQQRKASLGGFVVVGIAVLAVGVGAYVLYGADDSLRDTGKKIAADRGVQSAPEKNVAKGSDASTTGGMAKQPAAPVDNGLAIPTPAAPDLSERASDAASTEDAKSAAVEDPADSQQSTSASIPTNESEQASGGGSPARDQAVKTSKSRGTKAARVAKARSEPSRSAGARASTSTSSTSNVNRSSDADALATERLIARDLGRFGSNPTASSRPTEGAMQATRDRDQIETQRLVDRDLRAFRNAPRPTYPDRAFPEIN